jgi:hypothetical protein
MGHRGKTESVSSDLSLLSTLDYEYWQIAGYKYGVYEGCV